MCTHDVWHAGPFAVDAPCTKYLLTLFVVQLQPLEQYDLIAVVGLLAQLAVLCVQVVVTKQATVRAHKHMHTSTCTQCMLVPAHIVHVCPRTVHIWTCAHNACIYLPPPTYNHNHMCTSKHTNGHARTRKHTHNHKKTHISKHTCHT